MEEVPVALVSKLVVGQALIEVFEERLILSVFLIALDEALGVVSDRDLVAVDEHVAVWVLSLLEALDLEEGLNGAVLVVECAVKAFVVHDAEAFAVHQLHSGRCLGKLIKVGCRTLQVGRVQLFRH